MCLFSVYKMVPPHWTHCIVLLLTANIATIHHSLAETELRGFIGADARVFAEEGADPQQKDFQASINSETEFYWQNDDRDRRFTFKPYFRVDSADDNRSHWDIREAMFLYVADEFDLRMGVGKVFWGVTETLHLVDIVNQTDTVESFDNEEKLGQPMVYFSTFRDWGVLDIFVLPYFRERTFPSETGRLRPLLPVNIDDPIYESEDEQNHIDFAARWSNTFGSLDLGISGFTGTSREPEFIPTLNPQSGEPELNLFYPQINQIGIDALYVYESWLLKLEAIHRNGEQIEDFNAFVGGFEYSSYGVFDSKRDVGLVLEYAYDERKDFAPSQNDVSLAARIVMNDVASTEWLVGVRQDFDYSDSRALFVEGSTRIGSATRISVDAWLFEASDPQDLSFQLKQDDFVRVTAEYYF